MLPHNLFPVIDCKGKKMQPCHLSLALKALKYFSMSHGFFNPRWAIRGIVVPFVHRRLRRRRTQSFGYYTNMVQQIEFITHTNI